MFFSLVVYSKQSKGYSEPIQQFCLGWPEVATRFIRTISASWNSGLKYAVFLQMPIQNHLPYKEL